MKPRLFLPMNTWFPNRHQTIIRHLHHHFSLVVHERGYWNFRGENVADTQQLHREIGNVEELPEFRPLWEQYRKFMEQSLESILGTPPSSDGMENYMESTRPILADTLKSALMFDELAKKMKIDAVVTSTDYTRQARPIIYMAEQLGIPTITIEHGLFAFRPYPRPDQQKNTMAPFASNYVILDNPLEVDIFQHHALQPSVKSLLPLGTPLDNVSSSSPLSRSSARKSLHIAPNEPCIAVGLSWSEPHTPYAAVQMQADEVKMVRFIFSSVRNLAGGRRIRIILKLHPAMSDFHVMDSVRNFWARLALEYGLLSQTMIMVDRLQEVIAATDVMITKTYSSILWDCALQNTPTAIVRHDVWNGLTTPQPLPKSAVVDGGILQYIRGEVDMEKLFDREFASDRQEEYTALVEQFKQRWGIENESADVKSRRIVEWIQTLLN